jgi:hypothetical protein
MIFLKLRKKELLNRKAEQIHKMTNYFHSKQGRHGEFEPGKAKYSIPKFFNRLFLILERIETQNLSKAQALGALPAVAPLA